MAVVADKDVGRLEVAVNNQVGMRVGDGAEDVEEEPQPRLDPECVIVAVGVDGGAVDVLDDEVRLSR